MKSKTFYRSKKNRMWLGVCGGIGQYMNLDPTIIRIVWVLITIFSGIIGGLLAYIVLGIIIPEEPKNVTINVKKKKINWKSF